MKRKTFLSTLLAVCLIAAAALSVTAFAKGAEPAVINKKDGNYTVSFAQSGGAAGVSVAEPVFLRVTSGEGFATIVFENETYDALLVDGEEFLPTVTEENASFEIPVTAYDKVMVVTAVKDGKEVEYGMTFATKGIHKVRTPADYLKTVLVMFLAMVGAIFLTTTQQKRGKRRAE